MTGAVWLIGGSGTVGAQVARLLRRWHPELPLVIAARRIEPAQAVADEVGHAEVRTMDVSQPIFPPSERLRALVGLVNDPSDLVLRHALVEGVPYVDITRWPERQRQAMAVAACCPPRAPVVFASSWMASLAAVLAREAAARLSGTVTRIDLDVLYAAADRAGPDSVAYMDRLDRPFNVLREGAWQQVGAFTDGRRAAFGDGGSHHVYAFETPDLVTLPVLTGASTVAARIGFDDASATQILRGLVRSGLWALLAGPRWQGLRRSLLYRPGPGAPHRIRITAAAADGRMERVLIADPLGQAHLTALGAALQVERLLGLDGAAPPSDRVVVGEAGLDASAVEKRLRDEGVEVAWTDAAALE